MMNMSGEGGDFKPKSFWGKKEGKVGMVVLGLLGVSAIVLLNSFLPLIISFLTLAITAVGKTIVLSAMLAALAAFLLIVTNGKFQALVSYIFKSIIRKGTSVFIEIDPIGIMKNYIDDAKNNLEKIDDGISNLSGQIRICKNKIDLNKANYEKAMNTAAVAKNKGMTGQFTLNARQAGRLEQSNVTLSQLLSTMELHLRAMRKYREVSETVIGDMSNEVTVREDERKLIMASYSVMQAAKKVLNGDPDKKEMFDQAMEFVVTDYGMKLGAIENFIETSKSFVEGLDLQNGVFEADVLKKIQEWENKADSLLGDSKAQMIESSNIQQIPFTIDSNQVVTNSNTNSYEKFFTK